MNKNLLFISIIFIALFFIPFFANAAVVDVQVSAGADDGVVAEAWGGEFYPDGDELNIGSCYGRSKWETWFRFNNVVIPAGAQITAAYVSLHITWVPGSPDTILMADYQANPSAPTSYGDYTSRSVTTAQVQWAQAISTGWRNSPSIVSIIQELVNNNDYSGGAAIQMFHKVNGASTNGCWYYNSQEGSAANAPKLHIEYTTGAPIPDTTPPALSNGQPTGTLTSGTTQTNISLATNENSTCKYGTVANTSYVSLPNTFSTTGGVSHSQLVTGLTNGSSYTYYVRCQDTAGNPTTTDYPITFGVATPAPPDTTPPAISNTQSASITQTSATITWFTDDQSTSIVNYGLTTSLGSTQSNTSLVISHSTNLTNLTANTTYYYQVRSCNSDNYCANSTTYSFNTTAAPAAGATTIGALALVPTFENISVYSNFSGDSNGNNNAVLEYRENGGAWKQGIPMTSDRRIQVTFANYDTGATEYEANPFSFQWRAVIFWLKPNTSYEVRVAYTDADGVTGTNSITGFVTTLNDDPQSNGTTYYVSNAGSDSNNGLTQGTAWATVAYAVGHVQAGARILVTPGTYTSPGRNTPISTSGAANNYITLQSADMNNKAILTGDRMLISGASYWRIKGFNFSGNTLCSQAIVVDSGAHDIIIEDNNMAVIDSAEWDYGGPPAAITLGTSAAVHNILIQRNSITSSATVYSRFGIDSESNTNYGIVIRDNSIIGYGLEDGTSGHWHKDTFIYDNFVEGPTDDGYELEGEDTNCAAWGNTYQNNRPASEGYGRMSMGLAPIKTGPMYIFRNTLINARDAAFKIGNSGTGYTYIYHNTVYAANVAMGTYGNNTFVNNIVMRNNIIWAPGHYTIDASETTLGWNLWDIDYDDLFNSGGTRFSKWRVSVNYAQHNLAELQQAIDNTPQYTGAGEEHAISTDPLFVNLTSNNFRLQSASPAIDKGVLLFGFNDPTSPWPYRGTSPDIVAYEYY